MLRIQTLRRNDFLALFRPAPGEHVTVVAPTGGGKSTLLGQLLSVQDDSQLSIVLDTKPRNAELEKNLHVKEGLFRIRHSWPPIPPWWRLRYQRRFILKVRPGMSIDDDDDRLWFMCKHMMDWSYKKGYRYGGVRLYVDEGLEVTDLGLTKHLKGLWTRGRSQEVGFWFGTQRPRDVPLYAYSQATHIFIGRNPDFEDQQRIANFGALPKKAIIELIGSLPDFSFLYINRRGPRACIVTK